MGRRPQRDDRPARIRVVDDVLHLLVGQFAKPREQHHQVGRVQGRQSRDVIKRFRIDFARGFVDGKQDRAFEPVTHRKNLRHLRH